jgi:hypothetical protein
MLVGREDIAMVGMLGRSRKIRVFVSSTFRDLEFERKFVIQKLISLGFYVISMEADCKKDFDWRQWSINQAHQCDLYIFLFAERVGTQANYIAMNVWYQSTSELEKRVASSSSIRMLEYRLERPFPDDDTLFTPEKRDDYLKTIATEDRHSLEAMIARMLREGIGTPIQRVEELERRLEVDTLISGKDYFLHEMRAFYRSYVDQDHCAWHRAFEDETVVGSTSRFIPWELRRLGAFLPILFGILFAIPFAVLFYALPWTTALFYSALLLMFSGVIMLAYRPSFVWIGTKTIIARGAFGRILQRSIKHPFQIKAHWSLLADWTGLGALSVRFADGARVFVPLVVHPHEFVRDLPKKIREKAP